MGFTVVVAHVLKEENEDTRANAKRIIMDLEVARIRTFHAACCAGAFLKSKTR
jgi:hypothetical protein